MRHRPATCDGCGKPLWRDYLSTAGLDICCCLKSSKTLPQMYDESVEEISRLRAELAECKQDAKHRITRLRDALANLHGNCYVADAPTEMIAAEEALAAEALDAARKGEGE